MANDSDGRPLPSHIKVSNRSPSPLWRPSLSCRPASPRFVHGMAFCALISQAIIGCTPVQHTCFLSFATGELLLEQVADLLGVRAGHAVRGPVLLLWHLQRRPEAALWPEPAAGGRRGHRRQHRRLHGHLCWPVLRLPARPEQVASWWPTQCMQIQAKLTCAQAGKTCRWCQR